ncbi:MAG: formylglycine-generating enzyme family protein [Candidatus Riflebacteria bacterium]|nr:formylglycine-generating enzyme family protein [Candidatus Riflebacteria bacterium]
MRSKEGALNRSSIYTRYVGVNNPIDSVTYNEAKAFCDKLNLKYLNQLPQGYKFDLPTESQWEYACRAGTKTALNNGKNLTTTKGSCPNLDEVAWYEENSNKTTHSVGQKKPNAWGIYDMHGNVLEWCRDWYGEYPYSAVTDPIGKKSYFARVIRGGGFAFSANYCRSARRGQEDDDRGFYMLGFRVALVPID